MPYIRIWVHVVWATKERYPFLKDDIREKAFQHVREYANKKDIFIDRVNGYKEHIHCLISLKSDQNIANVVNLLKGESAYWINRNLIKDRHFGWQNSYFAISVGESAIDNVRRYIDNQQKHHDNKSFDFEHEAIVKKYRFERLKD